MSDDTAEKMLALADEYEAVLRKCEASGYEEYAPDFLARHRLVIVALRFSGWFWAPPLNKEKGG